MVIQPCQKRRTIQFSAVRELVEASKIEGAGNNFLVEHSAGSGKSNTIGWLAHRLASLHTDADEKIFDSIIVITDRRVLDKQLQDTIYQFGRDVSEHSQAG
ncbi:MAG: DEAD/DEAH box helicase family protein [Desulfotignum sp.]|nr:DEAD/DEAH box helicase family protein [Desulfotignum sp.]MCF8088788.1 DEAD/DEAH box helicase family protein [Desulfotignum sp.]MCF8139451.1 DEAD/DEAH box helicase family protein [Desulfotignum sp.]